MVKKSDEKLPDLWDKLFVAAGVIGMCIIVIGVIWAILEG